ncbi:integrase core domain-containing protein [Pectobacterium atrosepticum]|uniref:integrase core domain-containing protein n=1 Tax=Pectobacterium atrosepticum TaxID=29471 RepID=UPI00065D8C6E|nr:integrase core domain-containing protein [Pectobacterium atrosepticum]KMK80157.1 integrase [Pectobacterium atrosepticum ICMP 1526]MCH5020946.1 transposase [Pectobacterium atrosepticum]MDK9442857.1 integrase core domain-containing protein [Pectobacterium atrosepticum]QWC52474.1 transposase [Pectobacterium atrosepticum]
MSVDTECQSFRFLRGPEACQGACSAQLPCGCTTQGIVERFFLSLKMEPVWRRDYANHAEAIRDITEYIVGYYNNERLHSKLSSLPPTIYERTMASEPPIAVS